MSCELGLIRFVQGPAWLDAGSSRRIYIGDVRRQSVPVENQRRPVLGAGPDIAYDSVDLYPVDQLCQLLRLRRPDPPGSAIDDGAIVMDRGEVAPECDIAGLYVHSCSYGFEGASSGVCRKGIVAQYRQVGDVASGADSGRDGVACPVDAVGDEPVQIGRPDELQRRQSSQLPAGAVAEAVQNDDQDLLNRSHPPSIGAAGIFLRRQQASHPAYTC